MAEKDKHTEVMVALAKINTTLVDVVKPAVSQVYENQRAILTLNNSSTHAKDNRSRLVSYAALVLSLAVTILCFLRLYKPPHIPHP